MGYKDMVLGQLTQTAINERDNVYFKMAQEVEEVYRKAKAFDEVRKYALNKHDEFKDRKDRARNHIEYDYFSTLQIANNAVINKCKQLECVHNE